MFLVKVDCLLSMTLYCLLYFKHYTIQTLLHSKHRKHQYLTWISYLQQKHWNISLKAPNFPHAANMNNCMLSIYIQDHQKLQQRVPVDGSVYIEYLNKDGDLTGSMQLFMSAMQREYMGLPLKEILSVSISIEGNFHDYQVYVVVFSCNDSAYTCQ